MRHAKSLGAPVLGMSGNIYFDNIEVWDGMPDGDDSSAPYTSGHSPAKNMIPKTCINYFQEENYAFNINELQKCCACITRINLMRP